jgi:hypothetical protein
VRFVKKNNTPRSFNVLQVRSSTFVLIPDEIDSTQNLEQIVKTLVAARLQPSKPAWDGRGCFCLTFNVGGAYAA